MLQKIIQDTAANCATRRTRVGTETLVFENDGVITTAATEMLFAGIQPIHRDTIVLNDFAVSISDANVGGGSQIFTFPQGRIRIHDAMAIGIVPTTTSTLASTLNASVTLSVGVGTVQTTTQASGTLATTQQDIVNAFTATSSATINVAGTGGNGVSPATPAVYDGTSSAIKAWLNFGVPTATDIDGNATITVDGQVILIWSFLGDY